MISFFFFCSLQYKILNMTNMVRVVQLMFAYYELLFDGK